MKRLLCVQRLPIALFILLSACATISPFDQFAYVQVTSAKTEVLQLMDKATEPFNDHEKDVEQVNLQLAKITEYEKHRPKNGITIQMWNKLFRIDSMGKIDETSLVPSFWAKWKRDGQERAAFVTEARIQIAEGFDLIAELESQKIKPGDSKVATFLSNK